MEEELAADILWECLVRKSLILVKNADSVLPTVCIHNIIELILLKHELLTALSSANTQGETLCNIL